MAIFEGAGVALVTPFKENGEVNYEKLEEIVEEQIAGGTDSIIVCGTTGEASTMSHEEHLDVVGYVCKVTGKRIPVIAGDVYKRQVFAPWPFLLTDPLLSLSCRLYTSFVKLKRFKYALAIAVFLYYDKNQAETGRNVGNDTLKSEQRSMESGRTLQNRVSGRNR